MSAMPITDCQVAGVGLLHSVHGQCVDGICHVLWVLGVGAIEGCSKSRLRNGEKGETASILPVRALGALHAGTARNLTHGLCFYA